MALVTRHAYMTGLSEVPLDADQNRFDVKEYWDPTLDLQPLCESVCTLTSLSQLRNSRQRKYVGGPISAEGPDGIDLFPARLDYNTYIWDTIKQETRKKIDKLLAEFSSSNERADDEKELLQMPWPNPGQHRFETKFSSQPSFGTATGFMVAPGIVATAGHAIHMFDADFDLDELVAVFNLRAERNDQGTGWKYKFDKVFTIDRILLHRGVAASDDEEKTEGGWFAEKNNPWVKLKPPRLYDLSLLRLGPHFAFRQGNPAGQSEQTSLANTTPAPDWASLPLPLLVSNDAPSRTIERPGWQPMDEEARSKAVQRLGLQDVDKDAPSSGTTAQPAPASRPTTTPLPASKDALPSPEYFLLGHPHGLPLKISAHGKALSSPRILRPVDGFNATFTCDLDTLAANSGGPVFERSYKVEGAAKTKVDVVSKVIGVVRSGRRDNWGLSAEGSDTSGQPLLTQARAWIAKKVRARIADGTMSDAKPVPDAKAVPDSKAVPDAKAVPNAKAPSRMLDAQFITSYKNLTFDETRRQVYLRRYSEYSPVWETWQTFNRADFINPLVLDTQAWYTESADRAITLRMEMTLKLCGLEIIKPVLVVPVLKKQHSPYLHWGVGDVTLQKDQEIAESGQDYAYRAKFRWTRVFNNTVQLSPFRARGLTADADGVLVGDIDLNTLANAGIATWELMIVRLQLAPGYQGKACLEDARMLVTFRDKNVAESVEVKKKLNFESQDLGVDKNSNGKVVFSCDLQGVETEDEPWFGPQAVPPTPDIPDPQPVKGPLLEVKKERKIRPLTPNGSFYAQHTKWKLYNGVEPYTGYAFDVEGKPIPYYYEESAEGRITDGPTTVAEMEAKDLEFDRQSLKQAAKRQRVAREKAAAELDELLGDLRASKDATPASSATSTARTGTQPTTIKQPAVQGSAASKSVTPTPVATKSSTPAPPSAGSGAANIATTAKQPTPPSSQAPASTALTKPAAVKPASSMPGSTPSNTTSTAPASSAPASQPVATAPAGAIGGSAAKTTTPSSKGGK